MIVSPMIFVSIHTVVTVVVVQKGAPVVVPLLAHALMLTNVLIQQFVVPIQSVRTLNSHTLVLVTLVTSMNLMVHVLILTSVQ